MACLVVPATCCSKVKQKMAFYPEYAYKENNELRGIQRRPSTTRSEDLESGTKMAAKSGTVSFQRLPVGHSQNLSIDSLTSYL